MLPVISDSLISGQPLCLLCSNWKAELPADLFAAARAEQAMGSVRLQVTGRPPTISGPPAAAAGAASAGSEAAAAACSSWRRLRPVGVESSGSGVMARGMRAAQL